MYSAGKALTAVGGTGVVGFGLATLTFSQDKEFRTRLRGDYPALATQMSALIEQHAPRTAVVMRVADECDAEDPSARAAVAVASAIRGTSASMSAKRIMPAMPTSILGSADNFTANFATDLPPVAPDDPPSAADASDEQRIAVWRTRRVDGELSDSATTLAPGPARPADDDSHATARGGDLAAQLAWLRGKEALTARQLEGVAVELREHRRMLGAGLRGGGSRLLQLQAQARSLTTELADLADAKLSVKTYGVFR